MSAIAPCSDRTFCPAVNGRNGWRCDFAEHPYNTHATWVNGYPQPWSSATETWTNELAVPADPLRDAPAALRQP